MSWVFDHVSVPEKDGKPSQPMAIARLGRDSASRFGIVATSSRSIERLRSLAAVPSPRTSLAMLPSVREERQVSRSKPPLGLTEGLRRDRPSRALPRTRQFDPMATFRGTQQDDYFGAQTGRSLLASSKAPASARGRPDKISEPSRACVTS